MMEVIFQEWYSVLENPAVAIDRLQRKESSLFQPPSSNSQWDTAETTALQNASASAARASLLYSAAHHRYEADVWELRVKLAKSRIGLAYSAAVARVVGSGLSGVEGLARHQLADAHISYPENIVRQALPAHLETRPLTLHLAGATPCGWPPEVYTLLPPTGQALEDYDRVYCKAPLKAGGSAPPDAAGLLATLEQEYSAVQEYLLAQRPAKAELDTARETLQETRAHHSALLSARTKALETWRLAHQFPDSQELVGALQQYLKTEDADSGPPPGERVPLPFFQDVPRYFEQFLARLPDNLRETLVTYALEDARPACSRSKQPESQLGQICTPALVDLEEIPLRPYQKLPGLLLSGDPNPLHGLLVAYEVGSGKTPTAAEFLRRAVNDFFSLEGSEEEPPGARDVLFLLPSMDLSNSFQNDLADFYPSFRECSEQLAANVLGVGTSGSEVQHPFDQRRSMWVVFHVYRYTLPEKLRARWGHFEGGGADFGPRKGATAAPGFELIDLRSDEERRKYCSPPRVVVDEAHNVVDPPVEWTAAARNHALAFGFYLSRARRVRVCALTATPVPAPDYLQETFKLLRVVAGPDHPALEKYPEGPWEFFPNQGKLSKQMYNEQVLPVRDKHRRVGHAELETLLFQSQGAGGFRAEALAQLRSDLQGLLVYASLKFDSKIYPTLRSRVVERQHNLHTRYYPAEYTVASTFSNVFATVSGTPLSPKELRALVYRKYAEVRPTLVRVPLETNLPALATSFYRSDEGSVLPWKKTNLKNGRVANPKLLALKLMLTRLPGKHVCYARFAKKGWLGQLAETLGGWEPPVRANKGYEAYVQHEADLDKLEPPDPVLYAVWDAYNTYRWSLRFSPQMGPQELATEWFKAFEPRRRLILFAGKLVSGNFEKAHQFHDPERKKAAQKLLESLFNHERNSHGEYFQVFAIDSTGKEGLNTKAVQYVHSVTPFSTPGEQMQVLGRAMRFCSHFLVPEATQVELFVYAFTEPNHQATADEAVAWGPLPDSLPEALLHLDAAPRPVAAEPALGAQVDPPHSSVERAGRTEINPPQLDSFFDEEGDSALLTEAIAAITLRNSSTLSVPATSTAPVSQLDSTLQYYSRPTPYSLFQSALYDSALDCELMFHYLPNAQCARNSRNVPDQPQFQCHTAHPTPSSGFQIQTLTANFDQLRVATGVVENLLTAFKRGCATDGFLSFGNPSPVEYCVLAYLNLPQHIVPLPAAARPAADTLLQPTFQEAVLYLRAMSEAKKKQLLAILQARLKGKENENARAQIQVLIFYQLLRTFYPLLLQSTRGP